MSDSPASSKPRDELNIDDITDWNEIGEGSFGRVFRAEYLGTEVAVKECFSSHAGPDGVASSPAEFEKYLEREVEMLKEARHPNIVQFMGVCKKDSIVYILTEFVSGGNLKEWILNESSDFDASATGSQVALTETPLLLLNPIQHPPTTTPALSLTRYRLQISFAIDIARALLYLHARSIIHRDLKLENLLLMENYRVKVCDFGFSRLVARDDAERRRYSFCGTDGYMAPEIILCMNNYDNRVDIFSFGVLVLALMVMKVPGSDGPSNEKPFRRVIPGFGFDEAEVDSCLLPELPARSQLLQIITQCTHDDQSKRMNLKQALSSLKDIEAVVVQQLRLIKPQQLQGSAFSLSDHSGMSNNFTLANSSHQKVHRAINAGVLAPVDLGANFFTLPDLTNDPNSPASGAMPSPEHFTPEFKGNHLIADEISSTTPRLAPQLFAAVNVTEILSPTSPTSFTSNTASASFLHRSNNSVILRSMNSDASLFTPTSARIRHSMPHRFSLAISPLSLYPFKCQYCIKPIQGWLHKHLVCDECGFTCHKKCGSKVPANCGCTPLGPTLPASTQLSPAITFSTQPEDLVIALT